MTRRRATPGAPVPSGAARTPETTEPADRRAVAASGAPTRVEASSSLNIRDLDAAILRFLRRLPNQAVDLTPLVEEIGVDPSVLQLAVERLHGRRMVVAPFIEPGAAGGAELTEKGLRWLIEYEGGKPKEQPVALKIAKDHVRTKDDAARLPRAQVYGLRRP